MPISSTIPVNTFPAVLCCPLQSLFCSNAIMVFCAAILSSHLTKRNDLYSFTTLVAHHLLPLSLPLSAEQKHCHRHMEFMMSLRAKRGNLYFILEIASSPDKSGSSQRQKERACPVRHTDSDVSLGEPSRRLASGDQLKGSQ